MKFATGYCIGSVMLCACAHTEWAEPQTETTVASSIPATFVVRNDSRGQCFWILRSAGNRKTLFKSQSYKTEKACLDGIETVRRQIGAATIDDQR